MKQRALDLLEGLWRGVGCLIAGLLISLFISWPAIVWYFAMLWIWSR